MKQSALLMKLSSQPAAYDQRSPIPLKKPGGGGGYMEQPMNGGIADSEDSLHGKQQRPSDLNENLLLRQLQSKHDEGVSMVTKAANDAHCRTIDLNKSTEKFYNDMRVSKFTVIFAAYIFWTVYENLIDFAKILRYSNETYHVKYIN